MRRNSKKCIKFLAKYANLLHASLHYNPSLHNSPDFESMPVGFSYPSVFIQIRSCSTCMNNERFALPPCANFRPPLFCCNDRDLEVHTVSSSVLLNNWARADGGAQVNVSAWLRGRWREDANSLTSYSKIRRFKAEVMQLLWRAFINLKHLYHCHFVFPQEN